MPFCYAADAALLEAVDRFVADGGVLLCEAHLGGFDVDAGRHSRVMPGQGMAARWGIREEYTTSSYHVRTLADRAGTAEGLSGDVKKALDAIGVSGGKYFPVETEWGFVFTGAERFACLEAPGAQVVGRVGGIPCMVLQPYGKGSILYCGTNPGEGAAADRDGFEKLVTEAVRLAGVQPNSPLCAERGVHTDRLTENMYVVSNGSGHDVTLALEDGWHGVFSGKDAENGKLVLDADRAELLVRKR